MPDILERYHECICEIYTKLHPGVNREMLLECVNEITKENFVDLQVTLDNNVEHRKINTTAKNVFDWLDAKEPIISGAGSFFKQHAEYESPMVLMLESLMDDRSAVKKEMFKFDESSAEYKNLNTEQGSIKVIMNADYGGSGTPLSPFYSQYIPPATTGSAKNFTTTLIACLEYASGNKDKFAKLKNINELYDMIFIVLNDNEERELVEDTYTPDEVTKWLISRVNDVTLEDVKVLRMFLEKLEPQQLTKLMLAYNIHLVCRKYVADEIAECMDYFKSNVLDFSKPLTEDDLYEAGYGKKPPKSIVPAINKIKQVVLDNCIYRFIPNDPETRCDHMIREVVCVTDTDSLMVQFASYLDDFQAVIPGQSFLKCCLFASALGVRLFVEGIIPKFAGYVALGCWVKDKYYRDKLIFKNEFGFLSMALFAKKMYASSMFVQEGTPRNIHKIAVTGMSFKKRDAAEFLGPLMMELYDKYVLTTENIQVEELLNAYYDTKNKLKQEVRYNTMYYQVLGVKAPEAYDQTRKLPDQARGSILWSALFPDEEILPMDRVIVCPLSWENIEANKSNSTVSRLYNFALVDDPNKKWDPVICLPEHYHEIPEWLSPCIDESTLIDKLLSPFKQILGLFDVVMPETKGGMTASRMIYL